MTEAAFFALFSLHLFLVGGLSDRLRMKVTMATNKRGDDVCSKFVGNPRKVARCCSSDVGKRSGTCKAKERERE